jgi:hypothetical protein
MIKPGNNWRLCHWKRTISWRGRRGPDPTVQRPPKLISKSDWLAVRGLGTVQSANSFVPSIRGSHLDRLKRDSRRAVSAAGDNADVPPDCWDCKAGTKQIAAYGAQGNWMAILILFQEEGKYFDNINFVTAISRLAQIGSSLQKQDTLFLQCRSRAR